MLSILPRGGSRNPERSPDGFESEETRPKSGGREAAGPEDHNGAREECWTQVSVTATARW